jgi:single-strand DNA-binding protein
LRKHKNGGFRHFFILPSFSIMVQKGGNDMLNQVILVGRLVDDPKLVELESGKTTSLITLAVSRGFKNQSGEYETDFINCILWQGVAESTQTYCSKGSVIGVKGRISTRTLEIAEGKKVKLHDIIAEKVTFISPKKKDE